MKKVKIILVLIVLALIAAPVYYFWSNPEARHEMRQEIKDDASSAATSTWQKCKKCVSDWLSKSE